MEVIQPPFTQYSSLGGEALPTATTQMIAEGASGNVRAAMADLAMWLGVIGCVTRQAKLSLIGTALYGALRRVVWDRGANHSPAPDSASWIIDGPRSTDFPVPLISPIPSERSFSFICVNNARSVSKSLFASTKA